MPFLPGNKASLPFPVRQWTPIKGKAGRTVQTIVYQGPFFEKDVGKTFNENIDDFLAKVAAEGEADVKAQIQGVSGQMKHYTGWTTNSVKGRQVSIVGRHWYRTVAVSTYTADMDKKDAIRTKAAGSTIERRWHVFRRTTSRLRTAGKSVDLTRGLN